MIYKYIAEQLPENLQQRLLKKVEDNSDPLNVIKYIHSVCMITCSLTTQKTITPRLLPEIIKKVETTCTKKSFAGGCNECGKWVPKKLGGGEGSMPLSFYGMPEDMYQPVDQYAKDILGVDFENGVLRPEISPGQSGGGIKHAQSMVKLIARMLNKHCKEHDKRLSKQVKYYLSVYIFMKIDCLINKVKKDKSLSKAVSLSP